LEAVHTYIVVIFLKVSDIFRYSGTSQMQVQLWCNEAITHTLISISHSNCFSLLTESRRKGPQKLKRKEWKA